MTIQELIELRCAEIMAEARRAAESARRAIGQLTRADRRKCEMKQTGEAKLSDIQEWVFHLDLHVTEHDLSHAGKALRSAWPQVKKYFLDELQKQKRENDCLVRVINEYGKIRQNDKKRLKFNDGAEWAEQVCRAVGRRLSQGAGYACNIAADEIKDQLRIINAVAQP